MINFDVRNNGPVPFWFWNGDQQEGEITRQLELAAAGGLKGMAIHARNGNQTEYMSERWIELIRHCCKEAIRLGLDIWLYDEEGFPSGTVGNRLQKNDQFYQQKQLHFNYSFGRDLSGLGNIVAVYDAKTYERLVPEDVDPDQEVLAFRIQYFPRYVDTLQRETVDRFMEMTHEVYFKELKEYFGKPITHIYTDDLNSNLDRGPTLPFTESLPTTFKKSFGYDLFDHLPKLVENLPGCEKVRLHFRKLVLALFLEEFVSPMHEWSEEHGLLFTGHLSGDEGDFRKSVHRFGSAMAFYEHEHIPGIDDFLCSVENGCYLDQLRNKQGHSTTVLLKQAGSVANQLKEGICGGEVLTFLGWGAPVSGQSVFLNFELTLGINVFTHHDFSYATGGVAKRDCPPSYFFQQPYWNRYKTLLDSLSKSSQLLKRGKFSADTLIIHPMSSCWIAMDGKQITIDESFETRTESSLPEPMYLEDTLTAVSHELLKQRVGFEYGDEWLMSKHAKVEGPLFHIGKMSYNTVIIPRVSNLLKSTVHLLAEFEKGGGRLIAIEPSSDCMVDGVIPAGPVFGEILHPQITESVEELGDLDLKADFNLTTAPGVPVISHTRIVDGREEHFVCNSSENPQRVEWDESFIVYDSVEDQIIESASRDLIIPPFHSLHLLNEKPVGVPSVPIVKTVFSEKTGTGLVIPDSSWRISLDQANLLLIDWCDLPDGTSVYHTDKEDIEGAVRVKTTIKIPGPEMINSILGEEITLKNMRVNGKLISSEYTKHISSQDLVKVDSGEFFVKGENTIEFNRLHGDVLFEPFYLCGDFGVELIETVAGMRPQICEYDLGIGDLVEQGLPFYWGGINYETEIADTELECLDCGDVTGVVTLSINGKEVGCLYSPPYRFHIGDYLEDGNNLIQLTLYNTAQNLYGPHRKNYGVSLEPCPTFGTGNGKYYLAEFGINGPINVN